jgi:hypothetical protein
VAEDWGGRDEARAKAEREQKEGRQRRFEATGWSWSWEFSAGLVWDGIGMGMGAAAGACASAGWRKEGELEGLFGWCREFGGDALWGWAALRAERLQEALDSGGVSGRPGRAEASAADDLLEFASVGRMGRLPWTCRAICSLLICLLDELCLLRTSSSAGKQNPPTLALVVVLPDTIGQESIRLDNTSEKKSSRCFFDAAPSTQTPGPGPRPKTSLHTAHWTEAHVGH